MSLKNDRTQYSSIDMDKMNRLTRMLSSSPRTSSSSLISVAPSTDDDDDTDDAQSIVMSTVFVIGNALAELDE
jgi:hypothetical protein